MREIKFRAFIKTELGGFMIPNQDSDCFMVSNGNGFVVYDEYKNDIPNDRVLIMQCTGLKDKYGKEVYEGDILGDYGKDHPLGEYKAIVIWNEEKGEWYLDKAYCSGQRNLWRWCDKMKVIGNIYENKELL